MSSPDVLMDLLILSIVLSIVLAFASTLTLARALLDLEYQVRRGITGFERLQVWQTIRLQTVLLGLGVTFAVINIMLIAGVSEPWRMWINRSLWTVLLALAVGCVVANWFAAAEQARLIAEEVEAERKALRQVEVEHMESYRQIAVKAVEHYETSTPGQGTARPAVPPLAPVVPEHSSPTSEHQRRTADIATLRARLVARDLELGIAPESVSPVDPVVPEGEL